MPLQSMPAADHALQGTVTCAGRERRVWLFQVLSEPKHLVLSIEGAACFSFVPGERQVTGLDLVTSGCDLFLARQVIELLHETLPGDNQSIALLHGEENDPIEGNQTQNTN